ncbi:hypothetical protein N7540_007758 [Penicillium herquei]|nr:hypothetical protein N7540_007758 [Penicillium herquei]
MNGGCNSVCGETLKCGHVCPRKCHGQVTTSSPSSTEAILTRHLGFLTAGLSVRNPATTSARAVRKRVPKHAERLTSTAVGAVKFRKAAHHLANLPYLPISDAPPPPAPRQSIFYGRGNLQIRRPPPKNVSRVHPPIPPRPIPAQNQQATNRWVEFANGGAKVMDNHLGVLANATDLNSEEVQRALAGVDNGFLSKELIEAKEAQQMKQLQLNEPDLIDFEEEEVVEAPSQEVPVDPEMPAVPTGTLIELSD